MLGFTAPPPLFVLTLAGMVVTYLVLFELAKRLFFGEVAVLELSQPAQRRRGQQHRVQRRAARFSVAASLPGPGRQK